MARTPTLFLLLIACSTWFATPVAADKSFPIKVANVWARESSVASSVTAVYLSLANAQPHGDTLLSVASSAAKRAEVHETTIENGIARMRRIPALALPANSTVTLSPSGMHIMLHDLVRPLRRGSTLTLTLSFAQAGPMRVVVPVTSSGASATNVRPPPTTHDEH